MDIIAVVGFTIILFYISNEFFKYHNLEPMDFSIVYIVYFLLLGLAIFLPNGVKKMVSFK